MKERGRALESIVRLRAARSLRERAGLLFLLPGDLVCDWLGVKDGESRFLLRMFVNLGVYGKIAILLTLAFTGSH